MKKKYQVKYKETKDFIVNSCKLYNLENGAFLPRAVVAVGGVAVLFAMFVQKLPQNSPSPALFALKFLAGWAVAFIVGQLIWETLGKKMTLLSALGMGDDLYGIRMDGKEEDREVCIEFCEDHFTYITEKKEEEHRYNEVLKLVETEDVIGMSMQAGDGRKILQLCPKKNVMDVETETEKDIAELKTFLLEKCTGAKGDKFVFYSYGILTKK